MTMIALGLVCGLLLGLFLVFLAWRWFETSANVRNWTREKLHARTAPKLEEAGLNTIEAIDVKHIQGGYRNPDHVEVSIQTTNGTASMVLSTSAAAMLATKLNEKPWEKSTGKRIHLA